MLLQSIGLKDEALYDHLFKYFKSRQVKREFYIWIINLIFEENDLEVFDLKPFINKIREIEKNIEKN